MSNKHGPSQSLMQDYNKRLSYSAARNRVPYLNCQTQEMEYSTAFQERARIPRTPKQRFDPKPLNRDQPHIQDALVSPRRPNHVISNLKCQLQSIKHEVAKLIQSGEDGMGSIISPRKEKQREREPIDCRERYGDLSENSSVSSIVVSRRVKGGISPGLSDKEHYISLQNQILKNELKSFRTRYAFKKTQHKEEVFILKKKINFLEGIVEKREQELIECKQQIQEQISLIRRNIIDQNCQNNKQHRNLFETASSQSIGSSEHSAQREQHRLLISQFQSMQEENVYLKKRVSESNEEIKQMAIENNELQNQLQRNGDRRDGVGDKEQIQAELNEIIKQKMQLIKYQQTQIVEKEALLHQEVAKNNQLITTINAERENYQMLQAAMNSKLEELLRVESIVKDNLSLEQKYRSLTLTLECEIQKQRSLEQQSRGLRQDLEQLGMCLAKEKMRNQDLVAEIQRNPNAGDQQSSKEKIRELESSMEQFKRNVSQMIHETAQNINQLQIENQALRNQLVACRQQYQTSTRSLRQKEQDLKKRVHEIEQQLRESETKYRNEIKQSNELMSLPIKLESGDVDENIKMQMDCINNLRVTIQSKNQEIISLGETISILSNVIDNLKQELSCLRSKPQNYNQSFQTQHFEFDNNLNLPNASSQTAPPFEAKQDLKTGSSDSKEDTIPISPSQNQIGVSEKHVQLMLQDQKKTDLDIQNSLQTDIVTLVQNHKQLKVGPIGELPEPQQRQQRHNKQQHMIGEST